jgi:hypothetical protein
MQMLAADPDGLLAVVRGKCDGDGGATSMPNTATVFEIYCPGFEPYPSESRHPQGAFSLIDQRDFAEQRCPQTRELRSLANRETENTLENRDTTARGWRSPVAPDILTALATELPTGFCPCRGSLIGMVCADRHSNLPFRAHT